MITTMCVKVQAANPQMPLMPWFSFIGSPTTIKILDVPKSVGNWQLTKVQVVAKYPSNESIRVDAVRTGSVWTATIPASTMSGKVRGGYEIIANGTDENGEVVEGFVLGVGDITIMERDSKVLKDLEKFYVKFLSALPSNPATGDIVIYNGSVQLFDGQKWVKCSDEEAINQIYHEIDLLNEDMDNVKQDAIALDGRVDALETDVNEISNSIPTKVSELENDVYFVTQANVPTKVSQLENDQGYITLSSVPTKVSELENDQGYITLSSVPTKTSELTNDSNFITQADVPTKTSELINDSHFITQGEVDLGNAMKYDDNEHMTAHLGFEGHPFQMTLAHSAENGGKIIFGENAYIDGNHLNFANMDSVLNLGGNLHSGYVYIGPNIQINGMREEGKSNIAVDGKMLIKTPQDTREGQTLKAVNVSDSVGTSHIEWVAVDPESSITTIRTWSAE